MENVLEKEEYNGLMDVLEQAMHARLKECVDCGDLEAARGWAALMEEVGIL